MVEALKDGVVNLIRDLNGNHVVQRCLQRLGPEDSQFIYQAAGANCVDIATHRHGCCVLQVGRVCMCLCSFLAHAREAGGGSLCKARGISVLVQ